MAVWRSFDITESNGLKVDAVIALKFPAYLAPHERKIVWLIHQHRSAYELWDHPDFADLSRQEDGADGPEAGRGHSDRLALGEAKRIFTNSMNVADRLWNSLRLKGEVALPSVAGHGGALDASRGARRLPLLSEPARDL